MGSDYQSEGRGFEYQYIPVLDGHFFTLICWKNCAIVSLKINEKEAGNGPFKKSKQVVYLARVRRTMELFKLGCFCK